MDVAAVRAHLLGDWLLRIRGRRVAGCYFQEIIAAIRAGKLHFRQNSAHGNPYLRLLRIEVEALVREKSGQEHLHKRKLQKELADPNKEAGKLKARLQAIEESGGTS